MGATLRIPYMPRITITVPDQNPQPYKFSLDRQIVHFGRGDDNDIYIDSGSVSSEHAVMERTIGGYLLKDLGSTNGIKLDDERVDEIRLRNGQNIHIGDVEFGFELNEDEIVALNLEDPTSQLPSLDEEPATKTSAKTSPDIELKDDAAPDLKSEPKPESKPEPEIRQLPVEEPAQQKAQAEPLPELKPEPQASADSPQQQAPTQPASPQPQAAQEASPFDNPRFNKLVTYAAVIAFLLGVAMRFQATTGESIVTAIIHKVTGG